MRKQKLTINEREKIKDSYYTKKILLDNIRDEATLNKWKILSEAYKEGKKLWGYNFTRKKLSEDMDLPLTTVMRCLSLDRVNKKNWLLHKEKKISAFKLAMICQLKDKTYQDEIVSLVIKNNLSTYEIKKLKIKKLEDIKKEKLRLAVNKGYSRKDAAYTAMSHWITRGQTLLLMDKKSMGKEYYNKLEPKILFLHKQLTKYINYNGGNV